MNNNIINSALALSGPSSLCIGVRVSFYYILKRDKKVTLDLPRFMQKRNDVQLL